MILSQEMHFIAAVQESQASRPYLGTKGKLLILIIAQDEGAKKN
jgi:hypothetical protein